MFFKPHFRFSHVLIRYQKIQLTMHKNFSIYKQIVLMAYSKMCRIRFEQVEIWFVLISMDYIITYSQRVYDRNKYIFYQVMSKWSIALFVNLP